MDQDEDEQQDVLSMKSIGKEEKALLYLLLLAVMHVFIVFLIVSLQVVRTQCTLSQPTQTRTPTRSYTPTS